MQVGRPIERAGSHGRSLERLGSQVRAAAARGGEDGAQVRARLGPAPAGAPAGPGSDELVLVVSAVCVREGVCKPPVVHEKHGPAGVWLGGAQLGQHVGPAGGLPAVSAADAGRTGQSRPPDSRLLGPGPRPRALGKPGARARAARRRGRRPGAAPLARAGYRVGYTSPVPHWQRSERGLLGSNCHEFVIELHEQA